MGESLKTSFCRRSAIGGWKSSLKTHAAGPRGPAGCGTHPRPAHASVRGVPPPARPPRGRPGCRSAVISLARLGATSSWSAGRGLTWLSSPSQCQTPGVREAGPGRGAGRVGGSVLCPPCHTRARQCFVRRAWQHRPLETGK